MARCKAFENINYLLFKQGKMNVYVLKECKKKKKKIKYTVFFVQHMQISSEAMSSIPTVLACFKVKINLKLKK